MSVIDRRFRLRIRGAEPRQVATGDELARLAGTALRERGHFVLLELEGIAKATKGWEVKLYRFLGLDVPKDVRRLALYSDGSRAFATYEEDDFEWVVDVIDVPNDPVVTVKTEAGEPFLVADSHFMSIDKAIGLLQEFFSVGSRPESVFWTKQR